MIKLAKTTKVLPDVSKDFACVFMASKFSTFHRICDWRSRHISLYHFDLLPVCSQIQLKSDFSIFICNFL